MISYGFYADPVDPVLSETPPDYSNLIRWWDPEVNLDNSDGITWTDQINDDTLIGNASLHSGFGRNGRIVLFCYDGAGVINTTVYAAPLSIYYIGQPIQTDGVPAGRIMSGTNNNWLLGWWGGEQGDAFFEGWISRNEAVDYSAKIYGMSLSSQVEHGGLWSTVRGNGITIASGNSGTAAPDGISIGNGGNVYVSEWTNCYCGDILVYNADHVISGVSNSVFAWLNAKYGIY